MINNIICGILGISQEVCTLAGSLLVSLVIVGLRRK